MSLSRLVFRAGCGIRFVSVPDHCLFIYFARDTKESPPLHKTKKEYVCVSGFPTYQGFCPDPKHFIMNCEQNVVKFAGKWGKIYWKMQFLKKIFWQNKMSCRPTIPSFFRAETSNTHIFLFWPKLRKPFLNTTTYQSFNASTTLSTVYFRFFFLFFSELCYSFETNVTSNIIFMS